MRCWIYISFTLDSFLLTRIYSTMFQYEKACLFTLCKNDKSKTNYNLKNCVYLKILGTTAYLCSSLDTFLSKETDIWATDSSDDHTERLTITFWRIKVSSHSPYLLPRPKTDRSDTLAWKRQYNSSSTCRYCTLHYVAVSNIIRKMFVID